MNKNTKLALGIAVVGVGAYLIWKQTQKKTTASYTGKLIGKRQRMMSGAMRNIVDNQTAVKRPSTFNANGTVPVGKGARFFKQQDSGWLRATGNRCPKGQIPCRNNERACFQPGVNYVVDPCRTTTTF